MGKRVGLLGLLLVFALGSGTVAQSPSPGPSPQFAPDGLGTLLPSELGGVALTVTDWTGPDALAVSTETAAGKTRGLLIPMGKEPTDVGFAQAVTTDASAAAQYDIVAMRISGVAADLVLDRMVRVDAEAAGRPLAADFVVPMQAINGRSLVTPNAAEDTTWWVVYPHGEVLFMARGSDGVTLGDVLDELPLAESIEFLPAAGGPVVIGGRIEIPTAGFAIQVPHGWMGADLNHPDLVPQLESTGETGAWLADALEGHLGTSFDERAAVGQKMVLWASPADGAPLHDQHCEAFNWASNADSVTRLVELNAQHYADDPTRRWQQISLPAGQVARVDYEWSPSAYGSDYVYFDGQRFITLSCIHGVPVESVDADATRDRWLAIAETFEFLPVEE